MEILILAIIMFFSLFLYNKETTFKNESNDCEFYHYDVSWYIFYEDKRGNRMRKYCSERILAVNKVAAMNAIKTRYHTFDVIIEFCEITKV